MNKKLLFFGFIYTVSLIIVAQIVIAHINSEMQSVMDDSTVKSNISIEMNELKHMISEGDYDSAIDKCDDIIRVSGDSGKTSSRTILLMWIFVAINILFVGIVLLYIDRRILKPFSDMKNYANEISKGNMDAELSMDRENYFGDFTWAFENMRKEIIKSRTAERTAVENNKTVIATLSHDIKTPMSSIRAYAEAFEANMDSTPEKRQKYLSVLMSKCDEVSKLTNDLFVHSISEMNRLEVKDEELDIIGFIRKDVRELFAYDDQVKIILPDRDELSDDRYMINADSKRLLQIMENLKSNAEKYAKTNLEIRLELSGAGQSGKGVRIHFRDFGPGIPEEDIPFITGKFYRGKNCGDENGSGLGLYIVNELVAKMNGKLAIYNKEPGLDVVIEFS